MRLKNFLLFVVGVIVTLSLSGCTMVTASGKKFDMDRASEIKKGVTTKNDVLAMFGEPFSKSQSSYGDSWSYSYSEGSIDQVAALKSVYGIGKATMGMSSQSLQITFKGDIVQDYSTQEMKQ